MHPDTKTEVLGRDGGPESGPYADIGSFRARDGSAGIDVGLDVDSPHVALVVGKRGYGKSYTLGVLAEELAAVPGIGPIIVDPMGVFETLARDGIAQIEGPKGVNVTAGQVQHIKHPRVTIGTLPPRALCVLLDLDPTGPAGSLLWREAEDASSIDELTAAVRAADADPVAIRAVCNHLEAARTWDVFDPAGIDPQGLGSAPLTVLDCSHLSDGPMNALLRAIATGLYEQAVTGAPDRLPWLIIDEAHTFFDGIAAPALRRILTRGRQPGVSFVAATQRPAALPEVAIAQADLLLSHRLTAGPDREALERMAPSYLGGTFTERMPTAPGEVLLVDDVSERCHHVSIRERYTSHGGDAPRVSQRDNMAASEADL